MPTPYSPVVFDFGSCSFLPWVGYKDAVTLKVLAASVWNRNEKTTARGRQSKMPRHCRCSAVRTDLRLGRLSEPKDRLQ